MGPRGTIPNPLWCFRTACLGLQVYIPHIENPSTSHLARQELGNGTPGRIRTCDLLLRRQPLYPSELQAHIDSSLYLARRESQISEQNHQRWEFIDSYFPRGWTPPGYGG